MECLDLRICEFKVERAYLPNSYQCGWACPVISMDFKVKLYIKYKIYRWTYHDRMHIKVKAEKTHPNYFYIGERDFCIIEDKNPSDNAVVKEKIIEKTLSYYDFGGCFRGEDYRRSGWRKWHIAFFTDSGGPVKAIDLSGYWDASTCKFTQFRVEGDIEQPPTPSKQEITLTADRTKISEGETVKFTADVYGPPSTSVKTCVYVEGRRGDCYWVSLDSSGHGVLNFNATFPSYGTYHVKVCVVNPLTNEPIYCSNEVTVTVEKVGKPKLEITINVDKTEVNIGDKVKVYGEVKNVGDGTFSGGILHIYANDEEVTHIPVISLPPNHSQSFSCNIVLWEAGDYSIKACVEGDGMKVCSNPVIVRVAEPKVTISDPIAEKTSVEVGETVRISWKVRNESSVKVNATVQSYVNDKPYKGEVIYLNPKEKKEFAISIEFGEAGDYKVYACVEEVKVL